MNIWIFNQYAHAHDLPGGTRHFDLALRLKSLGHNVTIFSAGFHYTLLRETQNYNDAGYRKESKNGINFFWIKTASYSRNNYRRLFNIISYAVRLKGIIPDANLVAPDLVIGSTVHPFAGLLGRQISKKFAVPFVFEIRDLWPQTFIDMGIWKNGQLKTFLFRLIEKLTVRSSDGIVVLSPLSITYLKDLYHYPEDLILFLPNGVTDNFFREVNQKFEGPIKISYVGGIDLVHGLDFLVELARELDGTNIEFHIYGDGKERSSLENNAHAYNLNNINFHGSVLKADVPDVLNKANLLFVSTSNVLYGSENKLYEYMAAGKPIVVASAGNHNNPVEIVDCGVSLNRDDVKEAAQTLSEFIIKQASNFAIFGKNGQDYAHNNRRLDVLGKDLENFLTNIKDSFNDRA